MKSNDHFYKHQKIFERLDKFEIKPFHWISVSCTRRLCRFYERHKYSISHSLHSSNLSAGWAGKRNDALALAVILPCLRLIFHLMWNLPILSFNSAINILIRIVVFVGFAYLVSFARELRILRGLLHICAYCGRIKNDDGSWIPLQQYIVNHSEVALSHGMCPDCVPKYIL